MSRENRGMFERCVGIGVALAAISWLCVVFGGTSSGSAAADPTKPNHGVTRLQIYCDAESAKKQMRGKIGVGMIIGVALGKSAGFKAPATWLPCNGQTVDRATFPELARLLAARTSSTANSSGIRLPNYSGMTTWVIPDSLCDDLAGIGVAVGDSTSDSLHLGSHQPGFPDTPISEGRWVTWYVRAK